MSDVIQKPTKEEIKDIRSRLIFLKEKSNLLIIPCVLAYVGAYIILVIFNQTQYISSILALALLNILISIDKFESFEDEYRAIKEEQQE